MKFGEAIKAMKDRKKVRRKVWSNNNDYIYCDCDIIKTRVGQRYGVAVSCAEADDWEVYGEPSIKIKSQLVKELANLSVQLSVISKRVDNLIIVLQ